MFLCNAYISNIRVHHWHAPINNILYCNILFIDFVHCFCSSILFIYFSDPRSKSSSLNKNLSLWPKPSGKKVQLGRKRVSANWFCFYFSIGSRFIYPTKYLKVGPLSALVSISASCSFVFMWLSCIISFVTCSLIKWYCILICLVLAWCSGLCASLIADRLSVNKWNFSLLFILSCLITLIKYRYSIIASFRAIYSAL